MDPETAYDKYVRAILPHTGLHETTQDQLDSWGKQLMGGFYRGSFARGKEPPDDGTAHMFIVNGMTGPPGDHWHAVYREPWAWAARCHATTPNKTAMAAAHR